MKKIGIDIGGTFTDVMLTEAGRVLTLKVPSTPDDPGMAAMLALRQLTDEYGVDLSTVGALAHGTTVATNALLQRRGGKTALVTTAGFRDVLQIGRLGRPPQAIYNIHYQPPEPLIPRQLRFEIDERVNYRGDIERPLRPEAVQQLAAKLCQHQVDSVAICLLYSFLQPTHEHQIRDGLRVVLPHVPILCSCDILPERREYERTSTTSISAYLAPTVSHYLDRMVTELRALRLSPQMYLMQSNGGLNTRQTAIANPGSLLLSGPAAGVVAAARLGLQAGFPHLISIDMGGTSFDVALIQDGQCLISVDNRLEEAAFNVPMLNIKTIGAGGGSMGWLDAAQKLHVGPQSAGAQPGPACYGQDGHAPTVTDANLLLGFLNPERFLGGAMRIQPALAARAMQQQVATPLGLSVHQAAAGMIRIVNANMAAATRLVSIEKGYDPREFALLAFGGAGPLHAIAIAEELDIPWVLVPRHPGITSAAGLVVADIVHHAVQTMLQELSSRSAATLQEGFEVLERRAARALEADGVPAAQRQYARSLDIKYVGQGYSLNIPAPETPIDEAAISDIVQHFHSRHEALYGFRADEETVEMINLRVQATGVLEKPETPPQTRAPRDPQGACEGTREAWAETPAMIQPYTLYARDRLHAGHVLRGPAIVEQVDSTTLIPQGWLGTVDGYGNLILGTEEWVAHG